MGCLQQAPIVAHDGGPEFPLAMVLTDGAAEVVAGRRFDTLAGAPYVRLPVGWPARLPRILKRLFDIVVSTVVLVLLAPVFVACALAVRIETGPGVVFRQDRVGLHGRCFTLLKFRTLKPADAEESATRWSIEGDERIGRVGRILRSTSLDELPQLWNVLRGQMSLVGPRPERPFFVQQFSATYDGYSARHRVPVGITGLAQVNGLRGDTSIEERVRFDNLYIDHWSLWQDVTILLRTLAAVCRRSGRRARRHRSPARVR